MRKLFGSNFNCVRLAAIAITDKKEGIQLKFITQLSPEEEVTLTEAYRHPPLIPG